MEFSHSVPHGANNDLYLTSGDNLSDIQIFLSSPLSCSDWARWSWQIYWNCFLYDLDFKWTLWERSMGCLETRLERNLINKKSCIFSTLLLDNLILRVINTDFPGNENTTVITVGFIMNFTRRLNIYYASEKQALIS